MFMLKEGFYILYLQIKHLSSLVELAGLWKQPEMKVLVVGKKSQAESTLLHPALRNAALSLYLAPPDFFCTHRQRVSGRMQRFHGESVDYVIKSWSHTLYSWHSITVFFFFRVVPTLPILPRRWRRCGEDIGSSPWPSHYYHHHPHDHHHHHPLAKSRRPSSPSLHSYLSFSHVLWRQVFFSFILFS